MIGQKTIYFIINLMFITPWIVNADFVEQLKCPQDKTELILHNASGHHIYLSDLSKKSILDVKPKSNRYVCVDKSDIIEGNIWVKRKVSDIKLSHFLTRSNILTIDVTQDNKVLLSFTMDPDESHIKPETLKAQHLKNVKDAKSCSNEYVAVSVKNQSDKKFVINDITEEKESVIDPKSISHFCVHKNDIMDFFIHTDKGKEKHLNIRQVMWFTKSIQLVLSPTGEIKTDVVTDIIHGK